MKRKLFIVSLAAICLATVAAGTLAYYTTEDRVHNVITSGGVGIQIVETTRDADDVEVEFPEEGFRGVMPGQSISKIVRVKNTGEAEAWIRVKVDMVGTFSDGTAMWGTQLEPIQLNFNQESWTLDEEDPVYWYYTKPVAAGESTEVIFDTVSFDKSMGNAYQNCTVHIDVSAQAVQTANNGETVLDARGWPAETEQ